VAKKIDDIFSRYNRPTRVWQTDRQTQDDGLYCEVKPNSREQ